MFRTMCLGASLFGRSFRCHSAFAISSYRSSQEGLHLPGGSCGPKRLAAAPWHGCSENARFCSNSLHPLGARRGLAKWPRWPRWCGCSGVAACAALDHCVHTELQGRERTASLMPLPWRCDGSRTTSWKWAAGPMDAPLIAGAHFGSKAFRGFATEGASPHRGSSCLNALALLVLSASIFPAVCISILTFILKFHSVCLPWVLICYKSPIIDVPGVAKTYVWLAATISKESASECFDARVFLKLCSAVFLNWSSCVPQQVGRALFLHFEPRWARLLRRLCMRFAVAFCQQFRE